MNARGTLLVIGSNPPSETSGQRTRARVDQAATLLGFESGIIANLFALASYRSGGLATLGAGEDGWLAARPALTAGLDASTAVLLAYGIVAPTGTARKHHRHQLEWLDEQIACRDLPTWWVGGAPRHPSRWQRYTWRAYPDIAYPEALQLSLVLREGSVG